jgi:hypothetical protein
MAPPRPTGAARLDAGSDQLSSGLVAAVAAVPRVLADPAPDMQLAAFGANALELTIPFWIADPENGQGNVRSRGRNSAAAAGDAQRAGLKPGSAGEQDARGRAFRAMHRHGAPA